MRLTILFLFLCSFYSICGSDKADIDTLHQRAYRLLNSDPDSAFNLGALAEAKSADAGLDLEEAKSLFIQAYIFREKEELGKAFILYLRTLDILRPLEDKESMLTYAKILLNTGAILEYHYAYPQALQYYDEGIQVAQKHEFKGRLLKLYHNKSEALRQLKEYERGLAVIKSALKLARTENNEERIVTLLNQQGLILKDMGRYEEARASYRQVIDFAFDQTSPEKYKGQAWHNMAVAYVEEKRYEEAEIAYLNAAMENEKRSGSREEFTTWMDLGEVYYLMGNYKAAYEMEQKALALYDKMPLLPDNYAIFGLLSKITYNLGEHEQSHGYSERFIAVNRRFLQAQKEILQVKDQYKMEILTAGFFLEVEASKTKEQYQMMLGILAFSVIFVISFLGYEKVKQYRVRRNIKSAILDIEREFDV